VTDVANGVVSLFCHPRLTITFRDIAETDGGDAVIFVQIEIKTQRSLGPLT